jgi:hypothetical protein
LVITNFPSINLYVPSTGFYFAVTNIQASLQSWDENPVITTIDSASVPIKNVQFPTITICSGINISNFSAKARI